jgi:hypothetical protein
MHQHRHEQRHGVAQGGAVSIWRTALDQRFSMYTKRLDSASRTRMEYALGMLARLVFVVFLGVLLTAIGCAVSMTTTIENLGGAVKLQALCGDGMYEASLAAAGTITWTPTANSCSIEVTSAANGAAGDSAGRQLTIRNECRHSQGCSLDVRFSGGEGLSKGQAALSGSGQITIVGDSATASTRGG